VFPFLLPNIFTAFLSLTTFFLVYFYLPETYKFIQSVEMEAMEAQASPTQTPWPKLLKKYFLNKLYPSSSYFLYAQLLGLSFPLS
jgi:hypothetical protein